MHMLWDLFLCASVFIYWLKAEIDDTDDELAQSVKQSLCQCWASILLPFVVLKVVALAKRRTTPTLTYKRRYFVMCGLQMLAALALLICQAVVYQMTFNRIDI